MKWYKFGFTWLWDNLSLEIRNDRMSRDQAMEIVRASGEEMPIEKIRQFCDYIGVTDSRFFEIVNSFRNSDIWKEDVNVKWRLDGFLISDWKWGLT